MSLLNVLLKASISRVSGGLILNQDLKPLTKQGIETLIEMVRQNSCKAKVIYHLDDEKCVINKYVLGNRNTYHWVKAELIELADVSALQVAYEEACGNDYKKVRYRSVTIFTNRNHFDE